LCKLGIISNLRFRKAQGFKYFYIGTKNIAVLDISRLELGFANSLRQLIKVI